MSSMNMKMNNRSLAAGVIAIILFASLVVFSFMSGILVKWLWMNDLDLGIIFSRTIFLEFIIFSVTFIAVFIFSWFNITSAIRFSTQDEELFLLDRQGFMISVHQARAIATGGSLIFSLLFALVLVNQWETLLEFLWRQPFGQVDPIYHHDIGFYLFELPFYHLIRGAIAALFLISLITVTFIYFSRGKIPLGSMALSAMDRPVLIHISVLGSLFFLTMGAGFLLGRYDLLFSSRGVVSGMGYTDYHIVRHSLLFMFLTSLALAVLVASTVYLRRIVLLSIAIGAFILFSVISLSLLPAFTQKYIVRPNELALETPYLDHNITMTRKAYGLDRFRERSYSAIDALTQTDLADNNDTIKNIRLWDWRPILQTFNQTQAIRLYYEFYEVDVDRYVIPGEGYRQVMLSARELAEELPEKARTWVNRNLQYTHGYGLVMNTVSEAVGEGLPRYIIEDIPPVSQSLKVSQSAIYYGERTPGHRIVNTGIMELDYPKGDDNVYTRYRGTGGILLDSFWKKLLFAWELRDINILISRYLKPGSRIQIWRNLAQRMQQAAPFLALDKDPYLVLSQGRLYWIQDAYTISKYYPYSEPHGRRKNLNYIRNSVKVVMDAYDGNLRFYISDAEDPIIKVYTQAFPGIFKGMIEFPPHLKGHVRYPEDLFTIQVDMYRTYHMRVPQVFYNREDLWAFPQERDQAKPAPMQPYYVLVRLPGEKQLQYIMMMPLTPQSRNNMIAWIAGRSDYPWYGDINVFKLPKERIIYGPVQIEAMIDQDTLISQQLSLWDQLGSRVIRGNLLVIPIDNSFLYVEPVYMISEGTNIPQLKRVIMSYGGKVVMEPTVQEAVNALFGPQQVPMTGASRQQGIAPSVQSELLGAIQEAENALQQGNWTAFGKAMDRIKSGLGQPIKSNR